MINIIEAIELAEEAVGRQNPITTFSDIKVLYAIVESAKAGTLDFKALVKAGKLWPLLEAVQRESALALALHKDPSEAPKIDAIVNELIG